jgi:hypothetical protein
LNRICTRIMEKETAFDRVNKNKAKHEMANALKVELDDGTPPRQGIYSTVNMRYQYVLLFDKDKAEWQCTELSTDTTEVVADPQKHVVWKLLWFFDHDTPFVNPIFSWESSVSLQALGKHAAALVKLYPGDVYLRYFITWYSNRASTPEYAKRKELSLKMKYTEEEAIANCEFMLKRSEWVPALRGLVVVPWWKLWVREQAIRKYATLGHRASAVIYHSRGAHAVNSHRVPAGARRIFAQYKSTLASLRPATDSVGHDSARWVGPVPLVARKNSIVLLSSGVIGHIAHH